MDRSVRPQPTTGQNLPLGNYTRAIEILIVETLRGVHTSRILLCGSFF